MVSLQNEAHSLCLTHSSAIAHSYPSGYPDPVLNPGAWEGPDSALEGFARGRLGLDKAIAHLLMPPESQDNSKDKLARALALRGLFPSTRRRGLSNNQRPQEWGEGTEEALSPRKEGMSQIP